MTNVPYGSAVSDDARSDADAAVASFMDGSFQIYSGPMTSNDGRTIIPEGTSLRCERFVARDHGLVRRGRGWDDRRVTIPSQSRR